MGYMGLTFTQGVAVKLPDYAKGNHYSRNYRPQKSTNS
jgi:hypothetical protein